MAKKLLFVLISIGFLTSCSRKIVVNASLDIVPRPHSLELVSSDAGSNVFALNDKAVIVCDNEANAFNAAYLQSYLKNIFKGDFNIVENATDSFVSLNISEDIANEEGYSLVVGENGVVITGNNGKGVFYGIQTLLQMLPASIYDSSNDEMLSAVLIPALRIDDEPRFSYRGMMLDVSRTFFDTDYIYRFIDALSYYKVNTLHWHLADDQGWRVEIKKYPKLTEQGAWRGANEVLKPAYGSGMERNGGFYTQEQVRSIVRYAADRNVNIIPEIDLPGHSKAVAVTYPEILCDINTVNYSVQMESNNVWCIGREENYIMLEDIVSELADLFPSKIFHIGGDEVNMDSWRECPRCQALMAKMAMDDVIELQNYFVRRMESILAKYGKTMGGWDEIIDGGELMPSSVVYAWASLDRGMKSVAQGHNTVMQVAQYLYFDMKQSDDERGLKWAGITSLEKTYSFDPIGSFNLDDEQMRLVLGPQGGCWTECMQVKDFADYQIFPKLLALSEIGWTDYDKRDWADFEKRLFNSHYDRLYAMDLKFRIAPPEVSYQDGTLVASKENGALDIRYTDDGSVPNLESPLYNEPVKTDSPENYRFATFFKDRSSIARYASNIEPHHYMKPMTTVESNIPFRGDINLLADYNLNTYILSDREIVAGDYIKFDFAEPVDCHSIGMCTGYYNLAVYGVLNGYIEYSYDGVSYIMGERFSYDMIDGYRAYCYPDAPVKSVRIVADGICEHELTCFQDLRIE
ncbi:MAG: beta-N-acetylhexosaminidase [Candidatus Limimorpha sp.]